MAVYQIILIAVSVLLAAASGISRGVSNVISFHYDKSIFADNTNYNPNISWNYKNFSKNLFVRFLYRTVLVGATDPWHFYELLHRVTLAGSMIIVGLLAGLVSFWFLFGAIVAYAIFTFFFHIFFTYVFRKR